MGDGLRRVEINDPEWGEIKLMFPLPKPDNPWGVMDVLKGTEWAEQIVVVSGENMSHALHGWATPLMREIGVKPAVHGRRISHEAGWCSQIADCPIASDECRPGRDLPDCFEPPGLEGDAAILAVAVALAWREGRFVIVVVGSEFNLA